MLMTISRKKSSAAHHPRATPPSEEYRGEHSAPDQRDAPLHDLTGGSIYPKDVYEHGQRYYGVGDGSDSTSWSIAFRCRNFPLTNVRCYRAVPKSLKGAKILPGDWVTIDRKYAVEHGKDNLRNDYKILSKLVKAGELFTDGNSMLEWGYQPMSESTRKQFEAERRSRRAAAQARKAL